MKISLNCCKKVKIDIDMLMSKKYISTIFGFLLVGLVLILFGFAFWADMSLPTLLTRADEKDYPHSFIGERSKEHLQNLVDIGPKVAGTYQNEMLAVNYIVSQIDKIINSNENIGQFIVREVQKGNGQYYLDMKPYGLMNVYENIQNVIVKVHGQNSPHSILINCHYDTVPNSPGGTDDCINCATMLEVLRLLSLETTRPKHNIIFLFNGAEENPLQGSHLFITQHHWRSEVKVLINLESVGAGGREILFQVGPENPWLTNYYSKVPHPHAQVTGEEVFQSDLVPSDTDFRVFKKYSNLTGFDIAFTQNGYVYHTKYDDINAISDGTFQHVGDNLLTLVKAIANAEELEEVQSKGRSVYYDFLGLFLVHYSETIGILINSVTILISLVAFGITIYSVTFGLAWRYILLTIGAMLVGWIVAIGFALLVALLLDWWNCTMSWFGEQWLIFGLYSFPAVGIMSLCSVILSKLKSQEYVPQNIQLQLQIQTNRLVWTIILLVLTAMSIRSAYIIQVPVFINAWVFIIIFLFRLNHSMGWIVVYLVGLLLPTVLSLYLVRIFLALYIPLFGRSGYDQNPEMVTGVLSVVFSIIVYSYFVPFATILRKPFHFIIGLFVLFVVTVILIVTPFGFPYSGPSTSSRPQRFQIWHTQRTFYDFDGSVRNNDSGYFMLHMDRNSPRSVEEYVKEIASGKNVGDDCDKEIFCGAPVYDSRQLSKIDQSSWIPAEKPILYVPTVLNQVNVTRANSTSRLHYFTASGPSQMSLFISPKPNSKLVGWSWGDKTIPEAEYIRNGRPYYFVLLASGDVYPTFTFSLEIETTSDVSDPVVDVVLSGKYFESSLLENTSGFKNFLNSFPEWAHLWNWIATYEAKVF